MRIKTIHIRDFKRFSDTQIKDIPETARLVMLTGPNGSGKSSLFDAFTFWYRARIQSSVHDPDYFLRTSGVLTNLADIGRNIDFQFYGIQNTGLETRDFRKYFYIRTAYRHEADFTSQGLSRVNDALQDSAPATLMHPEARTSQNYNRIVGQAVLELFETSNSSSTALAIRDRIIGEVRTSMLHLFADLTLGGPGNPTQGGTFRFTKGNQTDFHFKNLSGGEKAAFDLLLDFIIKKQTFDDTIICIDEPELHMHTKLQSKLLDELFALLPANCQLWIATHSIGMARKADEINRAHPGEVAFIDFHDRDFDQPVTLTPSAPTSSFWRRLFDTTLDDLSRLVVPANVLFCEGRRIGLAGRRPSFDVAVYSKIFETTHGDTQFVPLGGINEVTSDSNLLGVLLRQLAPGISIWSIFDRDDRTAQEIADAARNRIKVLNRRDLESYLWDDEILSRLATNTGRPAEIPSILAEKTRLLNALPPSTPPDDIKAIAGQLFTFCRRTLQLVQCGNDTEAFEINTLTPLITPDTQIYRELETIIFSPFR
jgi:predicted ATPase